MITEKGLKITEEFFASEQFMELYGVFLYYTDIHTKWEYFVDNSYNDYCDIYKPGLSDENINALLKTCDDQFGCRPPQGYIVFAKKMKDFEHNKQYIYGFAPDDPSYPAIELDLIENNIGNMTVGEDGRQNFFIVGWEDAGDVDWYYCYDLRTGEYVSYNHTFEIKRETFDSFADMFIKIWLKAFCSNGELVNLIIKLFPEYAGYGDD